MPRLSPQKWVGVRVGFLCRDVFPDDQLRGMDVNVFPASKPMTKCGRGVGGGWRSILIRSTWIIPQFLRRRCFYLASIMACGWCTTPATITSWDPLVIFSGASWDHDLFKYLGVMHVSARVWACEFIGFSWKGWHIQLELRLLCLRFFSVVGDFCWITYLVMVVWRFVFAEVKV